MLSKTEYAAMIHDAIAAIEYPAAPDGLYAPIRYAMKDGGKRLRPMLTLAFAQAFGAEPQKAISQAIGIEMFHNFTLLHDDVMDNADMRRSRPTVHKVWNVPTAILSGDAMLTLAGVIVAQNCPDYEVAARVTALFNRTAMEVYEGQQYDMDFEARVDVTVAEYMEMIRLKTSVLLGCASAMGAIMAGADDVQQGLAYSYGEKLGLAFQLMDDYLDTYGDSSVFGKAIGGDILNDKKTWLSINAIAEDVDRLVISQISAPSAPAEKIRLVRSVYDRLELPRRCLELVDAYVGQAIDCLDDMSIPDDAKRFLIDLALQSSVRTH